MKKFDKSERSSWRYYLAHWSAFQMVALTLGIWKFKYLFHDWYKPWLKMLGFKYETIQRFHRTHSRHHIEYAFEHSLTDIDWDAMIIDWECSQYTKEACPHGAYGEMLDKQNDDYYIGHMLNTYMLPRLKELNLIQ